MPMLTILLKILSRDLRGGGGWRSLRDVDGEGVVAKYDSLRRGGGLLERYCERIIIMKLSFPSGLASGDGLDDFLDNDDHREFYMTLVCLSSAMFSVLSRPLHPQYQHVFVCYT